MNIDNLIGHIPESVLEQLPEVMTTFNIVTPLRAGHFLAQCGHESGGFTLVRENLNYSADALQRVFKKYFKTPAMAAQYARQPAKIGNRVYADRMGNGPEQSGDGYLYRGRGFIQLTGKTNYISFGKYISDDIVTNPDLVATKYPLLSAGWFWFGRKANAVADHGSSDEVVTLVTRIVNGGTNGLPDRLARFRTYYPLLLL